MATTTRGEKGEGKFHYCWIILVCCCCYSAGSIGILYGLTANFLTPVTKELHCSTSAFLFYTTVMGLVQLIMLPLAGKLISKYNLRLVLSISTVVMCGGFA